MTIPILLIGVPFNLSLHLCSRISVIHEDPLQGVFMQPSTLHLRSLCTFFICRWLEFYLWRLYKVWFGCNFNPIWFSLYGSALLLISIKRKWSLWSYCWKWSGVKGGKWQIIEVLIQQSCITLQLSYKILGINKCHGVNYFTAY